MIKIFSIHAKRTDFLKLHLESLRFFCEDDFEYFCIDNFVDQTKSKIIQDECRELNVNYVRFSNYEITGTAWDHAPALNSIKTISNDQDVNVIFEFDIFLINRFSFLKYIENFNISGIYQQRGNFEKEYIAPFIVIVNKDSEFSSIDFNSIPGDYCDVGGNTRFYIQDKNVKWMRHTPALNYPNSVKSFIFDYDPSFGCQVIENSFLHYYRGTNWDQKPENYEILKTNWLQDSLKKSKDSDIINHSYLDRYQTIFSDCFKNWNESDKNFNSKLNPYLNEN
jgi:hypothetical protein